ncbi:hypothetical protein ACP4OV_027148 [Aristida adscensionis]
MALDIFVCVLSDFILAGHRPGSEGPCLLFGGGVWGDASYGELAKGFCDIATAEPYMLFAAKTVSFAKEAEATVNAINERVKNATKGLVDGIISTSDIDAATGVVLADAASFVGEWLHPFVPSSTSPGSFHLLDGGLVEAMFMEKLTVAQVASMDGFKVLRLPYTPGAAKMRKLEYIADTQYSMLVFLPDARDGVAGMAAALPAAAPSFLRGGSGRHGGEARRPEAAQVRDLLRLGRPRGRPPQAGAHAAVLAGGGRPAPHVRGRRRRRRRFTAAGPQQGHAQDVYQGERGRNWGRRRRAVQGSWWWCSAAVPGHRRVRRRPSLHLLHRGGGIWGSRACRACP